MIEFTENEERVYQMWRAGESYADIAAALGITRASAYDIMHRRDRKIRLNERLDFIPAKITVRTAHALIRAGVKSREWTKRIGRDGLSGIKGIGIGTAEEIWRSVFGDDGDV
jgi:DNA-binding CsgD family transcriptional regulator